MHPRSLRRRRRGDRRSRADVRDGEPPAREEKQDPISSGPPRTTTGSVKASDQKPAPKAADPGPKPYRIPGTNHTFESWAEKFCDLVKTSEDTAAVYKWIDENTKDFTTPEVPQPQIGPLKRLEQKKPTVYATVRKTIEQTMQALRDAQAKAAEKAAKKPVRTDTTVLPPSEMEDDGQGDMIGETDAPASGNPEETLAWIEKTLAAVTEPEDLENVWEQQVEPRLKAMFPPDIDEAQAIYRKNSKRLEP